MAKVLCISCSLEFPNDAVYKQHKMEVHGGHVPGGSGTPKLPPGVTQDMLPDQSFLEAVQRIEGGESSSVSNGIVTTAEPLTPLKPLQTAPQMPVAKTEPEPIQLTYKYIGDCPTHKLPIDTLSIDIDNKHMVLAYCSVCKTNKAQRKVVALDAPEKPVKTAKIEPERVKKK